MGPHLKGFVPPFTPSGNAAMLKPRSDVGVRPAHVGIVVRWIADGEYLARLLPHPLEPTDTTPELALFINDTVIDGLMDEDTEDIELTEARFNEALFMIPCSYRGEPKVFHYLQYITSEHAAYVCNLSGLWTKLATIRLMLPFPPAPLHSGPSEGTTIKGTVSRFDQRIITVSFSARATVAPSQVSTFDTPLVGMRYFPDFTKVNYGRPIVHDLVEFDLVDIAIAEAWSGDATITFGRSEKEELYHFEPMQMLESYYINGFMYDNRGLTVLHDYRQD
jgi:hypothetical protein